MKRARLALVLLVTLAALFAVSTTALAENGGIVYTHTAQVLKW